MKPLDMKSLLVGLGLAIAGLLLMGQRSSMMNSEPGRFQATPSMDGRTVYVIDTANGRVVRLNVPVQESLADSFEALAQAGRR